MSTNRRIGKGGEGREERDGILYLSLRSRCLLQLSLAISKSARPLPHNKRREKGRDRRGENSKSTHNTVIKLN